MRPGNRVFNFQLMRALAQRGNGVVAIAPVSWTDDWRLRRKRQAPQRARAEGGIEVYHTRHDCPPGVMRTAQPWFMWRSVAATARRPIERSEPDTVIGYRLHPDGEVAQGIARLTGAARLVGIFDGRP
jgi:hypothetical protein